MEKCSLFVYSKWINMLSQTVDEQWNYSLSTVCSDQEELCHVFVDWVNVCEMVETGHGAKHCWHRRVIYETNSALSFVAWDMLQQIRFYKLEYFMHFELSFTIHEKFQFKNLINCIVSQTDCYLWLRRPVFW